MVDNIYIQEEANGLGHPDAMLRNALVENRNKHKEEVLKYSSEMLQCVTIDEDCTGLMPSSTSLPNPIYTVLASSLILLVSHMSSNAQLC